MEKASARSSTLRPPLTSAVISLILAENTSKSWVRNQGHHGITASGDNALTVRVQAILADVVHGQAVFFTTMMVTSVKNRPVSTPKSLKAS
jgi:hypothetical protein